MSKAMKGIGIIRQFNKALLQHSLITIYNSTVRPHLDYGDIIYDQPNKESPNQKIGSIQYNAAFAITGTYTTCQSKLYNKLGLESLKFRRWFRKYVAFIKSKQQVYHSTFLVLFRKPIIYIILVGQRM